MTGSPLNTDLAEHLVQLATSTPPLLPRRKAEVRPLPAGGTAPPGGVYRVGAGDACRAAATSALPVDRNAGAALQQVHEVATYGPPCD
jgi:hypothetical protein